jgi:hypothetical protein
MGEARKEARVSELAARAHEDAAKVAEQHGHLRKARDHRAFAVRIRAVLGRSEAGSRQER